MRITGATDTEFPDGERLPFDASHRLKAADGSIIIGTENYVDETCEMYIVSGYRNSVGGGCYNISILNSSGCVVSACVSHVNIVNSSGVTVNADHAIVMNSSGITVNCANQIYQNSSLTSSTQTAGKKVYKALLTQAGTDAPTAIILENTIGNIVWSRNGVGDYLGTLTGAFSSINKTAIQFTNNPGDPDRTDSPYWNNINSIGILTKYTGILSDDVLYYGTITIEVYT